MMEATTSVPPKVERYSSYAASEESPSRRVGADHVGVAVDIHDQEPSLVHTLEAVRWSFGPGSCFPKGIPCSAIRRSAPGDANAVVMVAFVDSVQVTLESRHGSAAAGVSSETTIYGERGMNRSLRTRCCRKMPFVVVKLGQGSPFLDDSKG
jgi:hypothetical protein